MAIHLFNKDNRENTKIAIIALIAGAFFFVGLSKLEVIDKLTVSPWLLIGLAVWLMVIVLKRKRHGRK